MNKLVSIAISTYEANGAGPKLLKKNLDEIMKQDYSNIEIVVSDHSSDNKIKNLCENYPKEKNFPIIYIHNPNNKGNSSQNTNNAINHCKGEYIKILFMDDYLYRNDTISEIVNKFEKNPTKKWLVHSYMHTKNYKDLYYLHHPRFSHDIVFCNKIGCPSCLTIHKSVLERFDEKLKWYMDCEFYYRILQEYGPPIFEYSTTPFIINLHHENQVTNTEINDDLVKNETIYIKKKYI